MTKIPTLILFLSMFVFKYSYSQNSPDTIIENFFSHLQTGNNQEAIESLPIGSRIESDTSFTAKLLIKLNENLVAFGKYCGYELIEQDEITESYIISEYLIKYLDAPRRIQFVFYKPVDKWQVNQVNINFRERTTSPQNRPARRL